VPSVRIFELLGFILGLEFGSLLNVCIVRIPRGESIVTPRSHCMACGHPVRWYDNIPILSWLLLRARCRDCKARIPWRYPAVELAVGLWFAVAGARLRQAFVAPQGTDGLYSLQWEQSPALVGFAILGFLLVGLMVMDWQTFRLPDAFTLTGIGIGVFLICVQAAFLPTGEGDIVLNTTHQLRLSSPGSFAAQGNVFLTGAEALVMGRIAAIAGAALLLFAIGWTYKAVRKRDGMGMGDVKLLAMIAALLGFWASMLALFAGVIAASVYGLVLIARGKAGATTRMPFGSFLAAGGLLAALFGAQIVDWYANLLR
jgi:leader peptidase (prepilin peptidase)/N-methyltransferase